MRRHRGKSNVLHRSDAGQACDRRWSGGSVGSSIEAGIEGKVAQASGAAGHCRYIAQTRPTTTTTTGTVNSTAWRRGQIQSRHAPAATQRHVPKGLHHGTPTFGRRCTRVGAHGTSGTELIVVLLPLHLPPPAALPGTRRLRRAARWTSVGPQRELPRLNDPMRPAAKGDAGQAQDWLLHGAQVGRAEGAGAVVWVTTTASGTQKLIR